MSDGATEDDDDPCDLPEPEPVKPALGGFAAWATRRHGGPPPYEESDEQVEARKRLRAEADPPSVERRRLRVARCAKRRSDAEVRQERARIEARWKAS